MADRTVSLAVGFAIVYHVSRYLGVERFGQFGLVQSFVPTFLLLSDFGISTILLRELVSSGADREGMLGSVTVLRTALAVVSVAACVGLARALGYHGPVFWSIVLYAASLVLPPLETVGLVFRAAVRNEYLVAASLASLLTYAAGAFTAVALDLGLVGIVGALLASNVVRAVVTVALARREVRPRLIPDPEGWLRLARSAAPLGVAALFGVLYGRLDMVLLSELAPSREMGLYSAAARFGVILSFFPQAFGAVLFPALARAAEDRRALPGLYAEATKVTIVLGVLAAGLLWGNAERIIHLVFGGAFGGAAPVLRLVAWQHALSSLNTINGYTLIAVGRQRDNMLLDGMGVVINAAALALLVPSLGAMGAAVAALATHLGIAVGAQVVLSRRAGCFPSGSLLAKTALAVAVMLVLQARAWAGIVLGPLAFIGLLLATRACSARELRALLPAASAAR